MIGENLPAEDYWFIVNTLNAGVPVTNPIYRVVAENSSLTETHGNPYSAGVHGFTMLIANDNVAHQYTVSVTTPWGSYSNTVPLGWISAGYIRAVMTAAVLTVSASCAWSLSFTSLTFYLSIGGGAEVAILTIGAQTISGTHYDRRLNCTLLENGDETVPLGASDPCDLTLTPTSSADGLTTTGGYWPRTRGVDPVLLDTATTLGSCTCGQALEPIRGTDSYSVQLNSVVSYAQTTSAMLPFSCPCLSGGSVNGNMWTGTLWTLRNLTPSVTIRPETPVLGGQNITTAWTCDDNSVATSGSSNVTTSPSAMTCQSSRSVTYDYRQETCTQTTSITPPCHIVPNPCTSCLTCTSDACAYTASSVITWTTLPNCAPIVRTLDYDTNLGFRHGRISANMGTGTIWTGFSPNGNPYAWVDTDTGISATNAVNRWQDNKGMPFGLLYDAGGGNLRYVLTPDEGGSLGGAVTIATTLATGGFFDFEEASDFKRWFYWLEGSSAPYTVYGAIYDAQFNVVRARAVTNITNADLATIKVRESPVTGGGRRIGILYTVSGVLTFLTSRDGLVFA